MTKAYAEMTGFELVDQLAEAAEKFGKNHFLTEELKKQVLDRMKTKMDELCESFGVPGGEEIKLPPSKPIKIKGGLLTIPPSWKSPFTGWRC